MKSDFFIIIPLSFVIFHYMALSSIKLSILIDKDFKKKQAFHNKKKSITGGLSLIFILLMVSTFSKNINLYTLIFPTLFFMIGFLDDFKIITSPFIRFLALLCCIIFFIISENFYVMNFGLNFVNFNLDKSILIILTFIGIFLIINGSNLIDGFNGLLSIHVIAIFVFLLSFVNQQMIFDKLIILMIISIMIVFLYFNLIKQNLFLGDSGAYFLGAIVAISSIDSSNNLNEVSPFFYANLLFYLYFETFFSVVRKICEGKNPFKPDEKHLHMLIFKYIKSLKTKNANNLTGISINFVYFFLMLPNIMISKNNNASIVYFIFLHLIYLFIYRRLSEKK